MSALLQMIKSLARHLIDERWRDDRYLFYWTPRHRPEDFIRTDIPQASRDRLAEILRSGRVIDSYFGHANCRLCNAELGCKDLGAGGFVWAEKAEHYVLEHGVWTPDCERLLSVFGE